MANIRDINDALKELLKTKDIRDAIREEYPSTIFRYELARIAQKLVWDIGVTTNEYGLKIGFNSFKGARYHDPYDPPVHMYFLEPGTLDISGTTISETKAGTLVSISIDSQAVYHESLYPEKYPEGTSDVIGLLTKGYRSSKWAFAEVGRPLWASRRTWQNLGNSNIITSRSNKDGTYGFPQNAPFVRDTISAWETKYADLKARVVEYPANWH